MAVESLESAVRMTQSTFTLQADWPSLDDHPIYARLRSCYDEDRLRVTAICPRPPLSRLPSLIVQHDRRKNMLAVCFLFAAVFLVPYGADWIATKVGVDPHK